MPFEIPAGIRDVIEGRRSVPARPPMQSRPGGPASPNPSQQSGPDAAGGSTPAPEGTDALLQHRDPFGPLGDPSPAEPISGPDELIERASQSPAAKAVIDEAIASGVEVEIVPDAQFDAERGAGLRGEYDPQSHSLVVRESLLTEDPEQAVQTFAHEMFHAVDRRNGNDEVIAQLEELYPESEWPDPQQREVQLLFHGSLVREARAYVFQNQVRQELGYEANSAFQQRAEGLSEQEQYELAWNVLEQTNRRNQPVTDRDLPYAYFPGHDAENPV